MQVATLLTLALAVNDEFLESEGLAEFVESCKGTEKRYFDDCNLAPCEAIVECPPVDGQWAEWGPWGDCFCYGIRERTRQIAVHASCGGAQVDGAVTETQECQPDCKQDRPVDCEIGDWSAWGDCKNPKNPDIVVSCGGGKRTREREILKYPRNGGKTCEDPVEEVESCAMEFCDPQEECVLEDWGEWQTCSKTCGGGQRERERKMHPAMGTPPGKGCAGSLVEIGACNQACCGEKKDCAWSDWSPWSACTATCGGGHKTKQRVIAQAPEHGGKLCGSEDESEDLMIFQQCNTHKCPVDSKDAAAAEWGEWSECSVTCGLGYQERQRTVSDLVGRGEPFEGVVQDFRNCPVSYEGEYEETPCHEAQDCILEDWTEWSACSSDSLQAQASRSRRIIQNSAHGGAPCGDQAHEDSYYLGIREMKPCIDWRENPHFQPATPVDCVLAPWLPWGGCSASCNGGTRARSREGSGIETHASHGGKQCKDELGDYATTQETEMCHMQACQEAFENQPCVWADWEGWSPCSATCGGGEQHRYRMIETPAKNMGTPCAEKDSLEVKECAPEKCGNHHFCTWGDWGPPSECSATCGKGRYHRERTLMTTSVEPASQALDTSIYTLEQGEGIGSLPKMALSTFAGFGLTVVGAALYGTLRRRSVAPLAAQ